MSVPKLSQQQLRGAEGLEAAGSLPAAPGRCGVTAGAVLGSPARMAARAERKVAEKSGGFSKLLNNCRTL